MLTNKSLVPLGVHDLRVVEGEPRFNDGRLALRLDLDRNDWRALIKRHEPGAIDRGLGPLTHGAAKSSGGRPYRDWFLTIEQTIYYASRSETKNSLDVIAEVAQIVGALRRGTPIPNTPWIDALFAPDVPMIARGADNVVHVTHERLPEEPNECERREQARDQERDRRTKTRLQQIGIDGIQGRFEFEPPSIARRVTHEEPPLHEPKRSLPLSNNKALDGPRAPNAFKRDVWIEDEDGISYVVTKKRDADGNVCLFDYLRNPPLQTSTQNALELPWINGARVRLQANHIIPLAVLERTYLNQLPDGDEKDVARNTLRQFLAL